VNNHKGKNNNKPRNTKPQRQKLKLLRHATTNTTTNPNHQTTNQNRKIQTLRSKITIELKKYRNKPTLNMQLDHKNKNQTQNA
jgi:hypothetical protein